MLDDDGYLTITDRMKDVIIRGGENISAREVESVLLGLPAVAEVSVVAAPDDRLGERRRRHRAPGSTAADGAHPGRGPGPPRRRRPGPQKWPESICAVSDLPRTPSGKVQKFVLRKQLRDGELEHRIS